MALRIRIDGHPGQRFAEVIRALPDGRRWLVSDPEAPVVIARSEGEELVREAIFTADDDNGVFELECLASAGISEAVLQWLVGLSLVACFVGLFGVWAAGVQGLLGLMTGLFTAAALPAVVLGVGQRFLVPDRDASVEAEMERALRFAIASVRGADLILNTDG